MLRKRGKAQFCQKRQFPGNGGDGTLRRERTGIDLIDCAAGEPIRCSQCFLNHDDSSIMIGL